MLSSPKISGSPRLSKNGLLNDKNLSAADDSAGGLTRSFMQPKITSTPVRKDPLFLTPPKQHILSPRRYSLSDIATPPRVNSREHMKSSLCHNSTGPLLTSTKFNVNVSTYEETKSPGLARRIVQYNEDTEREKEHPRPPTHQAKYGSPGLFPIVHLFKKKTPTLEQKPKRVTVRIASPEYTRYYQDYNHKLLEGLFKPSTSGSSASFAQANGEPSRSTRSVLDALKEISRKRIHSQEEYDFDEDSGKRQKTDLNNGEDSNKRSRDESPLLDNLTSPSKQLSKRVCMYDEYAASCSSTDYSFKRSDFASSKRKSVSTSTLTENPKDSKQVKLINAETQTLIEEKDKSVKQTSVQEKNEIQVTNEKVTEVDTLTSLKTQDVPLKIFDDAPLERIRKNRLAALMGSLTGKDPVLTPKPPLSSVLNGETEKSQSARRTDLETVIIESNKPAEKPLVSILSTHKKSPQKSEKHVTFSLPESTSQTSASSPTIIFSLAGGSNTYTESVTTSPSMFSTGKSSFETPAPPSSPTSTAAPVVSFTSTVNSPGKALESSNELNRNNFAASSVQFGSNKPVGSIPAPSFSFTAASTSTTLTTNQFNLNSSKTSSSSSTPPKIGGFRFDLTKPSPIAVTESTAAASGASTFSLGKPLGNKTTESSNMFGNSSAGTASGFSFASKTTTGAVSNTSNTPSISTGLTFGTTTTASPSSAPITSTSAGPTFKFNPFTTDTTPKSSSGFHFSVGNNTAVTTTNTVTSASSTFGLGTSSVTPPNPVFSFGSANAATTSASAPPTTAAFNFAQVTSAATSVSSSFGTPASNTFKLSTTSGFGVTSAGFGGSNNVSNSFGTSTNTAFGTSSNNSFGTSGFGASAVASNLGSLAPSTTAAPLGFGISPQNTGFAIATTNTGFGSSTTSAGFGPSTPSGIFGASTTTTGFGTPTTNTGFGAPTTNTGFGTPTTNTGFGASTTNTGFGAQSTTTGYGSSTTSAGFGTSAAATTGFGVPPTTTGGSFGGSSTPTFGSSATVPGFGTTTTTPSSFGSSSTSLFSKPAAPAFGQNNSTFGTATTTATFGSSNAFGGATTTASSIFGNAAVSTSSSFGTPNNNSNIFGSPAVTQASTFGAPSSNSIFATTTASVTPFGNASTTPTFGAGTNTPAFSFGAKTTASATFGSNIFGATTSASSGFGATTTASTFGTSTNTFSNTPSFGSTNTFGSSSTSGFGSTTVTQPSSFGNNNPPAFGTSEQGFGAASKASLFGNATTTGFGTNTAAPPTFGASSTTPAFGATAPVSNFGSSSTPAFGAASSTSSFPAPNTFGSSSTFGTNQTQTNTGFGAPTNPATTQAAAFNFGSAATSKPAVFSFSGAPGGDTKPTFNFTGGAAAPTFGAAAPSFGSSGAPSFAAAAAPQFGAPTPGMFSIGTGSPSTNRARIKAKRRN